MALPELPQDALVMTVGFRNYQGMYLTVETFNNRVNCSSKSMKKKQIFQIEQDPGAQKQVYLQTHNGRYLTAKPDGYFGADAETKGPNEQFSLEALDDGRFALVSPHGYLVGGTGDKLDAYVKLPPGGPDALKNANNLKEDRIFVMQLAMHPQISIWNINRKTFMRLKGDCVTTDQPVPWGPNAVITLNFFDDGKYGLEVADGRFLSADGQLKNNPDETCKFILRFYGGQVAFTDYRGKYLTSLGAEGICRATKDFPPSKDELYVLETSHIQIKMISWQSKYVSARTGVEVSANQVDLTEAEEFQIEIQKDTMKWAVRTNKNKFWRMSDDGAILSDGKTYKDASSQFDIEWRDHKLAVIGRNGKYVTVKKNGALVASSSDPNDESAFIYEVVNRPKLVLRGDYGFVGTMPSGVLECNKSSPEVYSMTISKGVCYISENSQGKYWKVDEDGQAIRAIGDQPDTFFVVPIDVQQLCIKYYFPGGSWGYLKANQNGALTVGGQDVESSTKWEY